MVRIRSTPIGVYEAKTSTSALYDTPISILISGVGKCQLFMLACRATRKCEDNGIVECLCCT